MRRSLGLPITMAVVMIVLVILLIVGWTFSTIWAAPKAPSVFWTLLPIGSVSLTVILAGVIVYLVLSVKLINLNRRQSNFIDAVTHELKSPLASLKLQVQTLERLNMPEEKRREFYHAMKNDVDRLETLIDHVLMVSVLESNTKPPMEGMPDDLSRLVEKAVSDSCLRYGVSTEHIFKSIPSDIVFKQRFAVELILQNLIDNAIKYALQNNPWVDIRVRRTYKGWLVIRISNNGPVIPPEQRKKIFLRFYRIGNELERKKTGTGLGLYIVKLLIRQIHGKLKIRDHYGKKGVSFILLLPPEAIEKREISSDMQTAKS